MIVESEHRDHAVVEQVIADLKDQALVHFPSGEFNANGAWTVLGALAHNLLQMGTTDRPAQQHRPHRANPAPPADHDRRPPHPTRPLLDLHLPARWPWQGDYIAALARIRALPAA